MSNTIPDNFEPTSGNSNYLRLTPGKHRVRILADAIAGYEYWEDTTDGGRKPIRSKLDAPVPVEQAENVKKFLAFTVWSYEAERVQIMEIGQASIQRELKALEKDKEWGDLQTFDIEIERTGTDKMSTRYRVSPKPQSELNEDVIKAVEAGLPNLQALFKSEDPFATQNVDEKDLPF